MERQEISSLAVLGDTLRRMLGTIVYDNAVLRDDITFVTHKQQLAKQVTKSKHPLDAWMEGQ